MGNCTSGLQKRKKGNSTDGNTDGSNGNKPNEDVTYASITHPPGHGSRPENATNEYDGDNDCDYATVKIPAEVQVDTYSESSKEECTDDYVLMG
ncbi:uncharacterized protein si:ch211-214p13.7 [Poeciliopsis prolifica]|uniref:uncharacterized protein si:ch211-214p13.7 n=1 Tax=Poeciliopsis prolifica TaxID=188132 RepID=UPI002412EC03|nr:uncharacterized protein si:ch211-214p13.7 [Poeciliopsis prolifica]